MADFHDHFSAVAAQYAQARPGYPQALFDFIAAVAPAHDLVWEAGCGSGQASGALAARFAQVYATDPSAAQVAQARAPGNVRFAVEAAERCSLPDAVADAACVAQALHWFDRTTWFTEVTRVLRPGGVLVAWGYGDVEVPADIAPAFDAFRAAIEPDWPPERAFVDTGYASFEFPFAPIQVPELHMAARWPLSRLLGYISSFSAVKRHREAGRGDPVAAHAADIARAWGDPERSRDLRWPLFIHARRKAG